jgi:hypothetical protein
VSDTTHVSVPAPKPSPAAIGAQAAQGACLSSDAVCNAKSASQKEAGNANPPANVSPAYSVIVVPASATLGVGQSQQFYAYLVANGGVPQDVEFTWAASGGVGTVAPSGLFTATSAGSGLVTATYSTSGISASGSASVAVVAGPPPANNSTSHSFFIVPASATLYIGGTQQFAVYQSLPNGSLSQVPDSYLSWAAAGGIGSVNSAGLFTAASSGSGTVSATYASPVSTNTSATLTAYVTVNSPPPPPPANQPYELFISPQSSLLAVGATQHFIAQLYDANGTYLHDVGDADLSWMADNPSIGAISPLGVFTAISSGTALVKAAYNGSAYANVSSQNVANVTVGASPPPASVSYILVTPNPASLFLGQGQQFIATAYDSANASLGVLPNSDLAWSVTPGIGSIGANGAFASSSTGSGTVTAVYAVPSPLAQISGNASVTVSPVAPGPIGGGGSSGGSQTSGNGGASFQTSTTVSFSCMGQPGEVKITVYNPNVKNATVEIVYRGESRSEKVFVKEITGTTALSFTPEKAGDYTLRVNVGTDQTNANFFVPYCGPQTQNVTQDITVRLEPSRELVFSKLVGYPGGFSKRFSVYKITEGQSEAYESDIVLYLNYTGNSSKYDFDVLDSVPSSVLSRASQVEFADRPSVVSGAPKFEWHVKSISKGGRLSYAYSFERPLTEQMIALFDAPSIREAGDGATPRQQDNGLLSASIGPIFGMTLPLIGVVLAFFVLLALLYFFLFSRKKEEE